MNISILKRISKAYLIVGTTLSFGYGQADVWLLQVDENGDSLWSQTLGGNGWDNSYYALKTNDDGYIIVGNSNLDRDDRNVFLIKTDSHGNKVPLSDWN